MLIESSAEIERPRARSGGLFLFCLVVAGYALRLAVARLGNNFDLSCWSTAGDMARAGRDVYALDPYYNYGPLWMYVCRGLRALQFALRIEDIRGFHLLVVAVLGLADVAVCLMLIRRFGRGAGLFFFFNPILILLTGFHSQVDTLAISFALAGWLLIEPKNSAMISWRNVFVGAILIGVSLITKHIFILFPLWVLMDRRLGNLSRRIVVAIIPVLMFAGSLAPFCRTTAGWAGVRAHVLQYHGVLNETLFTGVLNMAVPYRLIGEAIERHTGYHPVAVFLRLLFIAVMLLVGRWSERRRPVELLFGDYLLASMLFAISMADQYLAIPLIACAMFWRRWPSWAYSAAGAWLLLISDFNIASSNNLPWLGRFAASVHSLLNPGLPALPTITYATAQFWLIPLLLWRGARARRL